jgi:hypothetical protein
MKGIGNPQTYAHVGEEKHQNAGTGNRMTTVEFSHVIFKYNNIRGLSQQANYADRATAACRRS